MSTTMPALAAEQRIVQGAFEVGCTINELAPYVGIHRTTFTEKLNTGSLPTDVAEKILDILDVMKRLRYKAGLPVAWDQVIVCKPIVEQALVEFREQKNPTPNEFYVITTSSLGYFSHVRGNEVISVPSIAKAAAFSDITMAGTAARELYFRFKTRADFQAIQNHSIKRKLSEMISSFEQCGLSGNPGPRPQQ
jgi:hypothetical protein